MKKNSARVNLGWFSFDALVEIIFLAIVFLIPVIFDRRLGIVFSGTKVAWLRTFVIIILAVWAVKLVVTRQHRFVRTPLDWPVLAFLLTTTIATLTSIHVYTSFTGFYGRFEGLSTWYLFGLLFFIAANYLHSFEQLKRVIIAVLSAGTLMSVYGVIQRQELDPYMWGGVITWQRVIGTIGQPNFLAAYILMSFFLTLILLLREKEYRSEIDWTQQLIPLGYFLFSQAAFVVMIYTLEAQDILVWYSGFGLISAGTLLFAYNYQKLHPLVLDILLGICLVLIYVSLLYTQSRGGYMGFFTGAVLFALIAGRHLLFKNWKEISILGFLIVLISLFTMLRPEYSPFERFTQEIGTEQGLELRGAAGSRGETWKSAFKIIADNPLFGIGPEVLKMAFPRYETELFRFREAFHVKQDRCHNETFDVPVTKGLISFFVYLWLLFTVYKVGFDKLKAANDSQRLMLAGLLSAMLSYLIQNQFSFGVVAITSLFWVMWGMVMALGREAEPEKPFKLSPGEIPWVPVALVLLICLPLIYVSFLSFRADIYFKSGKTYLEMRRLPEATEELKKSMAIFPFEGTTISHLGIAYLNLGNTAEAIKYLTYGVQVDSYNADNFYMLARLFLALADRGMKEALEKSWENVEIALKIDPYYAEAYELKGQLYERPGKLGSAAQMYEKAFAVNPNLIGPIQKIVELSPRARKIFEEAARRFPDNIEIFKALEKVK